VGATASQSPRIGAILQTLPSNLPVILMGFTAKKVDTLQFKRPVDGDGHCKTGKIGITIFIYWESHFGWISQSDAYRQTSAA
jgi:hypothetical protein